MHRHLIASLAFVLVGCSEPFVMLPGGVLSGTPTPVPGNWEFARDIEEVQIQTRPSDPYSVNIWGLGVAGSFYVASGGGGDSTWAMALEENPAVVLRIGEALYSLSAARIHDAEELARVRQAYMEKYHIDDADSPLNFDEAWVYRFDPPPPGS